MIRDFIAIDFETANQQPSSVCSIGVVMVRNGQVADSFYSLIQPEPNYYNYWCQRVHGLSQCDTDDAPVFSKVWQQLEEKIADVFFSDQQSIDDIHYQIATIKYHCLWRVECYIWNGAEQTAARHSDIQFTTQTAWLSIYSSILCNILPENTATD